MAIYENACVFPGAEKFNAFTHKYFPNATGPRFDNLPNSAASALNSAIDLIPAIFNCYSGLNKARATHMASVNAL